MSVWTSLCFWRVVFCTAWNSWTSRTCLFELHSVFDVLFFVVLFFCTACNSWTSGACLFELHSISLYLYFSYMKYTPCSTWTSRLSSLWNSLWFEIIILKHKKQHIFYVFWTSKYTVNLSHKNLLNFPSQSTWTSSNHFSFMSCF